MWNALITCVICQFVHARGTWYRLPKALSLWRNHSAEDRFARRGRNPRWRTGGAAAVPRTLADLDGTEKIGAPAPGRSAVPSRTGWRFAACGIVHRTIAAWRAGIPKDHQIVQAFVLLCLIQINEGFHRRQLSCSHAQWRFLQWSKNDVARTIQIRWQTTR